MANYKVTDSELISIADAIRSKGGTSASLAFPSGFVSAISAIETQGTYVSKVITSNGEYDPASDNADAFSHVTVSVPTGSSPVLVSKSISENGTYNPVDDNADAYSQVVVNVEGGSTGSFPDWFFMNGSGSIINSTVSYIRSGIFQGYSGITEVEMTAVASVYYDAFYSCNNLLKASFPSCTEIGDRAFYSCSNLSDLNIEKCVSIGRSTFYACRGLSSLALPECMSIGSYAFFNCTSLSYMLLEKVKRMYSYAFAGCSKLESLILLCSSVPNIGTGCFNNTPFSNSDFLGYYGSIYVLSTLVDAYKSADFWSVISDRITAYQE